MHEARAFQELLPCANSIAGHVLAADAAGPVFRQWYDKTHYALAGVTLRKFIWYS